MDRVESLEHINSDKELRDEILTTISEQPELMRDRRLSFVVANGDDRRLSADRAVHLLEHPSEANHEPTMEEAIILFLGRPALLVRNDDIDFDDIDLGIWRRRLEPARDNIRMAIRSSGRLELRNHPRFLWVGTGWVIADDIIVTNRHVADEFAHEANGKYVFRQSMWGDMTAQVDFREEYDSDEAAEFELVEVLHIEPNIGPDIAFLRVAWENREKGERRTPLPLMTELEPTRNVIVVGYPAHDSRTGHPEEMDGIFRKTYDVKRLAPGEVTDLLDDGKIISHDCTTLGGNSGSVVFDFDSGRAVGLHFAGREGVRNYAVSAPEVADRLRRMDAI